MEVIIKLKKEVSDPEGEHTKKALELLGFDVKEVRSMKIFKIDTEETVGRIEEMCKKLLANPVINEYEIRI